jgi:signal transduction histidine kinase
VFNDDATTLALQVSDTGIGIAKEQQNTIFEAFRQADESHTRVYGGVGLGLSIVKQFVEMLDGKITLESDLGKGSVFTVYFPIINQTTVKEMM